MLVPFFMEAQENLYNDIRKNFCSDSEREGKTDLYYLKNANLQMFVSNYGATIVALWTPDRDEVVDNVCLGYRSLREYVNGDSYLGAAVGPLANRIANGRFIVDGKAYQMPQNANGNCLHSARLGISKKVWQVESISEKSITMTTLVNDEEHVFPANVSFRLTYSLTSENALDMHCEISTDSTAPINFTQHNYYNLKGAGQGDILNHKMLIQANSIVPVGEGFIPTGELMDVMNTPFDFRSAIPIGDRILRNHPQIIIAQGFDHTFVFDNNRIEYPVVTVCEDESGRKMEVFTNQPGIQFYTGNFLNGADIGVTGEPIARRGAFCLEAQNFPDAVNQPTFPDTLVRPNDPVLFSAVYKFSTY